MYNDLKNISKAKESIDVHREDLAQKLFKDAVKLLEKFTINKDLSILKTAADTLSSVIQYDDEHVGAYVCSSYIFYVLENNQLALSYLEKAEKLSPKVREKMSDFKSKLSNTNKTPTYSSTKAVVSKDSNFWNTMKKLF